MQDDKMIIDEVESSVRNVYNRLSDDISKRIYEERILYSLTKDKVHIRNIVSTIPNSQSIINEVLSCTYIWGAGNWGEIILDWWKNDNIKGVIDIDPKKQGKEIDGIHIYSPEEILDSDFDGKILISVSKQFEFIRKTILSYNVSEDKISELNLALETKKMGEKQYFSLECLPHAREESFVDVGCLDGETSMQFIKWSQTFSKIYCFEPDPDNTKKCNSNLDKLIKSGKVDVFDEGAWSSSTILKFDASSGGGSHISSDGIEIHTIKLDEVLEDKHITFIKMDIEGAELEALKGAERIIREQNPKLAICVYHKPEDIFTIPDLILKYNPDYHLYLRHYTTFYGDTVLYAI